MNPGFKRKGFRLIGACFARSQWQMDCPLKPVNKAC
jgi:hypothetical protein